MNLHNILLSCCFVWTVAAFPATPTSFTRASITLVNSGSAATDVHGELPTRVYLVVLFSTMLF